MKRLALEKLSRWKESFRRKPLLLLGARQVGKTWLMKEFGRLCFEHVAYVRFDSDRRVHDIFAGDFLLESESGAVPLEAKAEQNLRAKSLFLFCAKYGVSRAVRTSMHPYEHNIITLKTGKAVSCGIYPCTLSPNCGLSRGQGGV